MISVALIEAHTMAPALSSSAVTAAGVTSAVTGTVPATITRTRSPSTSRCSTVPGEHVPWRPLRLLAVQRHRPRVHDGEHIAAGMPGRNELAAVAQPDPTTVGVAAVEVDADEIGDVPGAGPFAQFGERPRLDHPAGLEHDHPIAQGHGVDRIVGHHDPRALVRLEVAAQLPARVDTRARVECRQRFVEQEDAGVQHQCPSEGDPLGLPPAQRTRARAACSATPTRSSHACAC